MKIFLICPVRDADKTLTKKLENYVASLESRGHTVHYPRRDTKQNDITGGMNICRTNFNAMAHADEIHIWYDESSNGSKFDMGGAFMRIEIMKWKAKVHIANLEEAEAKDKDAEREFHKKFGKNKPYKSFFRVIRHLAHQ